MKTYSVHFMFINQTSDSINPWKRELLVGKSVLRLPNLLQDGSFTANNQTMLNLKGEVVANITITMTLSAQTVALAPPFGVPSA